MANDKRVAALAIGVVDHAKNLILAEVAVPETSEITLGSRAGSTLLIPATYGIESRTVVHGGALLFFGRDTVAAYRDGRAEILQVSSPMPITESLILESGQIRVLIRRVWIPSGVP